MKVLLILDCRYCDILDRAQLFEYQCSIFRQFYSVYKTLINEQEKDSENYIPGYVEKAVFPLE